MEYTFLLGSLENVLGKSFRKSRDNYAFHCPFCNHRKPKLEINMNTDAEGRNYWECWVCQTRGQTVYSLAKQLKLPSSQANEILKYVKNSRVVHQTDEKQVELPKEFQALSTASETSVIANKVKNYLYGRGLTANDFLKYHIGYTSSGEFGGRIIIPSFDGQNHLNYFVGRTYERAYNKYKNPETSKDIIFFENLINWNKPIIICEGVFDAIAVGENSIPIFGKFLPKSLRAKIRQNKVKRVNIVLDSDAKSESIKLCEYLQSENIDVRIIEMQDDEDPSTLGHKKITELISKSKPVDFAKLLEMKFGL